MPAIHLVKKSDHWFHSKTPAAKKAYIAKHPDSKYAKNLRGEAIRKHLALSPEERATKRAAQESVESVQRAARVKKHNDIKAAYYEPKAHEKRQAGYLKSHDQFKKKMEKSAAKVTELTAKLAQHKANGKTALMQKTKIKLEDEKRKHKSLQTTVKDRMSRHKLGAKNFKEYHATQAKKAKAQA